MKKLLASTPDIDTWLSNNKIPDGVLETLGIKKSDLKTLQDLIDLSLVLKGLKGDPKIHAYIQEACQREKRLEALNSKSVPA